MIPKLTFGRTGHLSTRAIFGAGGVWLAFTQSEADRTLDLLLQYGVNHIDTAANYGDAKLCASGRGSTLPGAVLPGYQDSAAHLRRGPDNIRRSLERLQTDHIDLIQMHFLVDEKEWQVAMGPGGALGGG